MKKNNHLASYLDVSEFVLKEHSPLFKPKAIFQHTEVCIMLIEPHVILRWHLLF